MGTVSPRSCPIVRKVRDSNLSSFSEHYAWKTINEATGPELDFLLGDFAFYNNSAVAKD